MYIETVPNRTSPPAILLREGYREGGKVVKRTLATLSHWDPQLIEHLRILLKGGVAVESTQALMSIERSLPHGHVAAVLGIARRCGLAKLLDRRLPRCARWCWPWWSRACWNRAPSSPPGAACSRSLRPIRCHRCWDSARSKPSVSTLRWTGSVRRSRASSAAWRASI